MKTDIYGLLGMIKDGNAPKKIKINNNILILKKENAELQYKFQNRDGSLAFDYYVWTEQLDYEVKILDEEILGDKENENNR